MVGDEQLWAEAAAEWDGPNRRPGLWAQLFVEAKGDINQAKAAYLSRRFDDLKDQQHKIEAARRAAEVARLHKAMAERIAQDAKALAYLPNWAKGTCPNCDVLLLLSAPNCKICGASFEGETAWKPKPLPEP